MKKLNIISHNKVAEEKYKFYSKWEDFIKNNKKLIDEHVNTQIKGPLKEIRDTKQRDKKYNEWMRDYRNELTTVWNNMKKHQNIAVRLPKQQLENAVKIMQLYLGSLDRTRIQDQQKLYNRTNMQIQKLADQLGMHFDSVWDQVKNEAEKRGRILPQSGKDI